MDRQNVFKLLAEFFMDSFREDSVGVGDWVAQGGDDIDELISILKEEGFV